MKIAISNRQKLYRIDLRRVERLTAYLATQARRLAPERTWNEISLVLGDDALIRPLNAQYLQRDNATDVISFQYEPIPGVAAAPDGEIVVNVERAVQEGSNRRGRSPSQELALYIAHGCNHLTGADDDSQTRRNRMRQRELRWLRSASQRAMTEGLITQPLRRHKGSPPVLPR